MDKTKEALDRLAAADAAFDVRRREVNSLMGLLEKRTDWLPEERRRIDAIKEHLGKIDKFGQQPIPDYEDSVERIDHAAAVIERATEMLLEEIREIRQLTAKRGRSQSRSG